MQRLVAELKPRQVCSMIMSCQMREGRKQKDFSEKGEHIVREKLETLQEEPNYKSEKTNGETNVAAGAENDEIKIAETFADGSKTGLQ